MKNNITQDKNKHTSLFSSECSFRMFITLYTSRVVLGVSDYGIYNVVGGIVAAYCVCSYCLRYKKYR